MVYFVSISKSLIPINKVSLMFNDLIEQKSLLKYSNRKIGHLENNCSQL